MSELVKVRRATAVHDGKTYDVNHGDSTEGLPAAVVKMFREGGALGDPSATPAAVPSVDPADPTSVGSGGAEGKPDPNPPTMPDLTGGGGGSTPPPPADLPVDAPDAAEADVVTLAAFIDAGKNGKPLNAPETIALAKGDPALADKILEAESTAQGGDSRSTVVSALEKLKASAES